MIRAGLLEPIGRRASRDGIDLDDFPQVLIDRFRASDAVYAIPCAMQSQVLHYRLDLLGRYAVGIPMRWDELGEAARRIQRSLRDDGILDVVGLAGWDSAHAGQMARARDEENRLYWLEDPLPEQDIAGYQRLHAAVDTRICTG